MSIEKVKYFSNKTFYMINIFTGSEAMFADLCYFRYFPCCLGLNVPPSK